MKPSRRRRRLAREPKTSRGFTLSVARSDAIASGDSARRNRVGGGERQDRKCDRPMGTNEDDRERQSEEPLSDSDEAREETPLEDNRAQRWTVAVPWLEAQRAAEAEQAEQPEAPEIPASRIGRS